MFDGDYPFVDTTMSEDLGECHLAWLAHLCRCVPHAEGASLLLGSDKHEDFHHYPTPLIPPSILNEIKAAALTDTPQFLSLENELQGRTAIVCKLPATHLAQIQRAGPSDLTLGVLLVVVPTMSAEQLGALGRLIRQNLDWHRLLLRYAKQPNLRRPATSTDGLANLLQQDSWPGCANVLSDYFCEEVSACRVIICELNDATAPKLLSVSGVKSPDARQLCNTASLRFFGKTNAAEEGIIKSATRQEFADAYAEYSTATNIEEFIAAVHTTRAGRRFGLIFESAPEHPGLTSRVEQTLEPIIKPGAEWLGLALAANASITERLKRKTNLLLGQMFGADHLRLKLIFAASLFAVIAACIVPVDFKIAAPVELAGASQRAVAAPFDGYIAAAHAEAGMTVEEGQILLELDERQLSLELEKWQSEKAKLEREYDLALSKLKQADAQIIRAQIGQADAELNLVQQRLAQSRVVAPFAGVIISGDLDRLIGSPVDQGEVLFEIAPLNDYQVVLSVDERDIYHVASAQTGSLVLNALPQSELSFVTTTVASAVPSEDGKREFRVEADLQGASEQLRPGMEGLGKILVGKESLAYILSRRFVGWLQLNLWAKLP